VNASDRRRAELAKIHILAKQLGLDDQAYRAVLWAVARADSARDLDSHGRTAVLEQLQSRLPGGKPSRSYGPPDRAPLIRKIHQLLGTRPVEYAMGILDHMYGRMTPERLEWASVPQLRKVVAALEYDRRRHAACAPTRPEVPA
jgi:phage gp16-like protein